MRRASVPRPTGRPGASTTMPGDITPAAPAATPLAVDARPAVVGDFACRGGEPGRPGAPRADRAATTPQPAQLPMRVTANGNIAAWQESEH